MHGIGARVRQVDDKSPIVIGFSGQPCTKRRVKFDLRFRHRMSCRIEHGTGNRNCACLGGCDAADKSEQENAGKSRLVTTILRSS